MQKREKELLKNSLILSIGALAPKLLAILTVPVLTSRLPKDVFGQYDLISSTILLAIPVLTLQIQQGVFRFLMTAESEDECKRCVSGSLAFVLGGTGLAGLAAGLVMTANGLETGMILLIVLTMMLEAMYMLAGQTVRGQRKTMVYSFGAVVYSCVYMLLVVWLIGFAGLKLRGVLAASCGGYLAAVLFMFAAARTYRYFSVKSVSVQMIRKLLSFSAPIVPSSVSLWAINFLDRLVIVSVLGTEMNGVYSVAAKVSQIYTAVYGIFTMAWSETAVQALSDGEVSEYYSTMLRGVFRTTVGIMLMMFALTPAMYRVLIHPQYGDAYPQTLILYFGMFFNSMVSFFSGIYIALKQTKSVGISSTAGAAVNLIINILLIRKFGLNAASLSTAISFAVIAVFRGWDLGRKIGMKYSMGEMAFGLMLMLLALGLMLQRNLCCTALCLLLAAVYNLKVNRSLMIRVAEAVRKRFT